MIDTQKIRNMFACRFRCFKLVCKPVMICVGDKGSVAQQLRCWTLVLRVAGYRPSRFSWLFVSLDKALYSDCSVVQRSCKAIGPICPIGPIWSTFHILLDLKEHHRLFEKNRGILPVPLTVYQNTSLPLGPEWARAIVAGLSPLLF